MKSEKGESAAQNQPASIRGSNWTSGKNSVNDKALSKLVAAVVIVAALIFAFDLSQPLGVAGGVPYVALVLLGIRFPRHSHVYILAATGTVLTILGFFLSPVGGISWMVPTNRGLALFAIWVTAFLIDILGQKEAVPGERDERRIKQVLVNILSNAVKFTPEGVRNYAGAY